MGMCIGSCLGSCASTALCKACNVVGPKSNQSIIPYALFSLMVAFIAILLQMVGHRELGSTKICDWLGQSRNCEHNASPFRIFTVLSWFYLIHIVMTRLWASFHKSFWIFKVVAYTAIVIATYFWDNKVFEDYAIFAVVCASIFIVIQVVVFINMCYDWNESWVSREWFIQIVAVTVAIYVSAGVVYGVSIYRYGGPGCIGNRVNISLSIVTSFLLTALSIYAAHGAILPSAGVTLYLSWILFSGLSFGQNRACNKGPGADNAYAKVLGMVMVCISIGYFCLSNSRRERRESERKMKEQSKASNADKDEEDLERGADAVDEDLDEKEDIKSEELNAKVDDDEDGDKKDGDGDGERSDCWTLSTDQRKNLHFYILMFLGSLFVMMVFCRWELRATDDQKGAETDNIVVANVIAHWGAAFLYLVTLIAPLLCPGRFADDEDSDE